MRVICRHGYYAFYPDNESDIGRFCSLYNIELVSCGDHYTFPILKNLADFSIKGMSYGPIIANTTYEGSPWDIMKANSIVYSLSLKTIVPISSIIINVNPPLAGYYFVSESPMIQAGSLNASSDRLKSFDAVYYFDINKLRVRSFSYE